jgi:hypothetical protein
MFLMAFIIRTNHFSGCEEGHLSKTQVKKSRLCIIRLSFLSSMLCFHNYS